MLSRRSFIFGSNCRKNFSRSYNNMKSMKFFTKLKTPYKCCILLASAAAVGVSAYIVHKNKINCDIIENKVIDIVKTEKVEQDYFTKPKNKYEETISKSRDILLRIKDEVGTPGMVVGVSIDGKTVWTEGLGYADIENRVLCSPDTVMRIASISKSITIAAVGKLLEQGKLNLDKPVQEYVPTFPQKTFDGKPVDITCRHLVSHLAGIRHYSKNGSQNDNKSTKNDNAKKKEETTEFEHKEYYIKDRHDVKSSLSLFKDDPLIVKPGTKFYYTTHGFTLLSAVVEAITKEDFPRHMTKLFKSLGMQNTYLDENDNIIYYRSRNYKKNKNGHLINTPYVDNSYKWAGGGILSTVSDLLKFANAMLYSYQFKDTGLDQNNNVLNLKLQPGFLNSKTMETIWTPVTNCNGTTKYAMGWVAFPEKHECEYCEKVKFCVYHTGGAIGASSILLILPKSKTTNESSNTDIPPKGVAVAILTNLMSVNLTPAALKIADLFDNL